MKVSNVTVRRRLLFILITGTFLFTALIIRLGYVQLWMGPALADKAEDSWRRQIPFTAKRGEILDRNGVRLAYNVSSPTVMAIPAQIRDPEAVSTALSKILHMSKTDIHSLITQKKMSVYINPDGRKISLEKASAVRELALPGIIVAEDNKRYYPFSKLGSHLLGFTGIDNQGLAGIELSYDKYLTGIQGNVSYLADAKGREMPGSTQTYQQPKDGLNLLLTLDKHIQQIVERELDQAMLTYEADQALAIVMDPNNGEILAMSAKPDYDPTHFRDYDAPIYNRNLPIWMTYEPGSTFKIITLAAALEENKVDLDHDVFTDTGEIHVGGATLHCWKHGGHGSQTFLEGVENSCNPGFVILGQRLGKEKLFDYIDRFGFGHKTGIDLHGEENGILFRLKQVGPVELATTSFGQGISVTPIQQVAAVAAAVNGGKLYKPHLAKAWIDPVSGHVINKIVPELKRTVISEQTSAEVRRALESVVANGTGRNAFIDGYRVGGKTGTAQKVINGRYSPNEHIVSFVGFAPADDPKVVIYVAVDNPKGLQFGGLIVAPIVRNMMEDTLHYIGVEPRENQLVKKYRYGDTLIAEVPNLVGMSRKEIYESLHANFSLSASGTGNVVISQAPKAGARIERGSSIRVFLSDK